VRKAINKAIDREALSDVVFAGTAIPAHQLWAPGSRFHDPEVDDELAYDPEATRQLLADAGYPDGIEFDAYVLPSLSLPEVAEVIQPQLAEVGITMNILLTPDIVNGFMTPSRPGAGLIPLLPEGRVKLEQWRGDAISNTCGFEDPQIDTFATELSSVSDSSEEAVEIWHDVADHVTDEALSVLLVFGSRIGAYDSDVLSDVVRYPKGTFFVPDIFTTYTPAA